MSYWEREKPINIVRKILIRASRDTWLMPDDYHSLLFRASQKYGNGGGATIMHHAFHHCCSGVGMIRGNPPAYPFEPRYKLVLQIIKKRISTEKKMILLMETYK